MTALIEVQRCAARLPSWIPDGVSIFQIEVTAVVVHRNVVVTIASQTAEFGVLIERVATSRVGNEREEVFVTKVVDPRPRCLWVGDDIFPVGIIKVTVVFVVH